MKRSLKSKVVAAVVIGAIALGSVGATAGAGVTAVIHPAKVVVFGD